MLVSHQQMYILLCYLISLRRGWKSIGSNITPAPSAKKLIIWILKDLVYLPQKGNQFCHKSKYRLLTEFEVCTVSYRTKFFFLLIYAPSVKHTSHKSTGKNEDQRLTLRTEKMRLVIHYFIISRRLIRWAGKAAKLAWQVIQ